LNESNFDSFRPVQVLIKEVKKMNIRKIREIARQRGVNPGNMIKTELIRAIQRAEGNPECFATGAIDSCNQMNCLWRTDCKAALSP
jgi:hypothetical protein